MKRLFSVILVLSMLIVLFSCARAGDDKETMPSTTASSLDSMPDTAEETKYQGDDVPASVNFSERVINIASSDRSWYEDEVTVSDLNGEVVNDSVYERNINVENRLGVKINNIKIPYANSNSSTVDAISKAVLSGTPDYDIVYANAYVSIDASIKGIYRDLLSADYLDLSKSYWAQGVTEAVEFKGSQFLATGSIALSTMRFAFVTIFNKNMFDANGISYLYDVVREGKWTLDYQYALVRDMYIDTNGSNTADEGDMYGFITNDFISTDPYWLSCNVPILGRDGEGNYSYILDPARLSSVVDKLIPLYEAPGTFNIKHKTADAEQDDMRRMFAGGNGAMVTLRLMEVEHADIRNMKDLYGIVPMPKFSETQENYHTHMHDQFTVVSIVGTVQDYDLEVMGAFLEVMASESHKSVVPAYYETALKYKYSSDPESWEMLDIVVENTKCDAGILLYRALSNVHGKLRTIMESRSNTVASTFKTLNKIVGKQVSTVNESLDKILDN